MQAQVSGVVAKTVFWARVARSDHVQLGNAYQELGKELGTETLKVVGGYTLGRVIGEGESHIPTSFQVLK